MSLSLVLIGVGGLVGIGLLVALLALLLTGKDEPPRQDD